MSGSLYVVATPIGNLDDISARALDTLRAVGLIAAEDTRRTSKLLKRYGIATPATSLHEHNESQKTPALLGKLAGGLDIALVSDAGTPTVSDPGQRLVARAIEGGIPVVPIPGPSAILAALTVSGYPADQFVFAGFAPGRKGERDRWFDQLKSESRVVVFFEAPHRIRTALHQMRVLGDRPICVCRELTKVHEEIVRTTASEAAAIAIQERGEFTVVVGLEAEVSAIRQPTDPEAIIHEVWLLTNAGHSRRSAAALVGSKFGLSTNEVYALAARAKPTRTP